MAIDVNSLFLHTRLKNYLNQSPLLISKNIKDNMIIKEIILKINELSNKFIKLVQDIKKKFDVIEEALSKYNVNNINQLMINPNPQSPNSKFPHSPFHI